MAPILSHGQTTSGQCGFNQVASHPADPIKRHRARRERSHPKAMLNTQTSAVALDLLENRIRQKRPFVADVAREEKHEDLESKQIADPDLSLECAKRFGNRNAPCKIEDRLSDWPGTNPHEIEDRLRHGFAAHLIVA